MGGRGDAVGCVGVVEACGAACSGGGGDVVEVSASSAAPHVCAICRSSSLWAAEFARVERGEWHDGERVYPALVVEVCADCLSGHLSRLDGRERLIAASVSLLLGRGAS